MKGGEHLTLPFFIVDLVLATSKAFALCCPLDEAQEYPYESAFYDALETNAASVRELGDAILKEITGQLTDFLRRKLAVNWSVRETMRARIRGKIKLILKRHKYPPDLEARAIELVLKQAEAVSEKLMA